MIILPASQIRAKWSEILERIAKENTVVVVTRHGSPIAVITSYEKYVALNGDSKLEQD